MTAAELRPATRADRTSRLDDSANGISVSAAFTQPDRRQCAKTAERPSRPKFQVRRDRHSARRETRKSSRIAAPAYVSLTIRMFH
jgi:hypothetical protein